MTKIAEFANSVDLDEVAHNEIKIYTVCPLVFEFSTWYSLDLNFFEKFVVCFSVVKELKPNSFSSELKSWKTDDRRFTSGHKSQKVCFTSAVSS